MKGIDTSELEEGVKEAEVVDEGFEGFDEERVLEDLNEGLSLVKRCKTLLDYIGDPELCKTISKRERTSMAKLATKLGAYVSSIDNAYGEVNDALFV
jgi:hypothetical protein